MARIRSRVVETESVNQRMLRRGAVKRQHISRWAVGHDELAPGVVGLTHLQPRSINETHIVDGVLASGAHIHAELTAPQTIAVAGEAIAFDSLYSTIPPAGFTVTTWPVTDIPIQQPGYYDVLVALEEWDSYDGGGTVEVFRVRGDVVEKVWPPNHMPTGVWSATTGTYFSPEVAKGIPFLAGDAIRVVVDHDDASTHDLTGALIVAELIDRAGSSTSSVCPTVGADVTIVNDSMHNAFPGIAVADNGDLIVAYRRGVRHAPSVGLPDEGTIVVRRSTDDGATWSAGSTVLSTAGRDWREATLATLADGTIVMSAGWRAPDGSFSTSGGVFLSSSDAGATWSAPVTITHGFTSFGEGAGTITELDNGDLLTPFYGKDTGDTNFSNRVSKSTDGGATWSPLAVLHDGDALGLDAVEPGIVKIGDTLVGFIRGRFPLLFGALGGGWYRIVSEDDGATWSTPVLVSSVATGGARPKPVYTSDGRLFALWRQADLTGAPGKLARSLDMGVNWTTCHTFLATGEEMEYGQIAEADDGILHIVHAYAPTSVGTTNGDVYYAQAVP